MNELANSSVHVDVQRDNADNHHPEHYVGKSPTKAKKLGPLVYEASDVERTARFWRDVMGFEETDRNGIGMIFFRCGADHHAIGLKPGKAKKRPLASTALKVEHLAVEVEIIDDPFAAREYLQRNNIPIVFQGRKRAGSNAALHFCTPDGYEFELYCNMDQIGDDSRLRPKEQFRPVGRLEDARDNPFPNTW